MENSRYRWVIVAAGGLLGCVAIGGMFSLPVFLQPIARDTGWSVTGISSAMTIGFLAMAFTSMIWGTLSDKFGPLPVVLTGSIVLPASLALAGSAIAGLLIFHIHTDAEAADLHWVVAVAGSVAMLVLAGVRAPPVATSATAMRS